MMSGKRLFILIDKTDSEFLDRIVEEIQESEKRRRGQEPNTPGPLLPMAPKGRAALKNSDEERG